MSELKTCFKKVDYDLGGLLHYIEIGDMYRGFPVGYFLFRENVTGGATKQIGVGSKQHTVARLLIVDGQQGSQRGLAVFC